MNLFGIDFGKSSAGRLYHYVITRSEHISFKVAALISPTSIASNRQAKQYLFSRDHIPPLPDGMVESDDQFLRTVISSVQNSRRCLIVGGRGSGKTTRALEIHRKIMDGAIEGEAALFSVFLQASRFQFRDGPESAFVELISNTAASTRVVYRKWLAKRMASGSSLVVILDDLDFVNPRDIANIEEIIETHKQHVFIGVASERPRTSPCWNSFDLVKVPDWDETTARRYIEKRIPEAPKRDYLVLHLEELDLFHRFSSPFEWACLLNIYSQGRVFEIFHPKHLTSPASYSIQRGYFEIVVTKRQIDWNGFVKNFGLIALNLSIQGLQFFDTTADDIDESIVDQLTGPIFQRSGNKVEFVPPYQSFFAGLYLAQNWPNSKSYLADNLAPNLVWTAIYNCAVSLCAPEHVSEIHSVFHDLATIALESKASLWKKLESYELPAFRRLKFLAQDLSEPRSAMVEMVRRHIWNILVNSNIDSETGVERLGRLALRLVMEPRQYFYETEARETLTESIWDQIRPKEVVTPTGIAERESKMEVYRSGFLEERQGRVRFIGSMALGVLAGYYLGTHFAEAKQQLNVNRQSPIWLETCQVALKYCSEHDAEAIKELISFQWTKELNAEWHYLLEKEAVRTISSLEMIRLEELSEFRESILCPMDDAESSAEKMRTKRFEQLKNAFDAYAECLYQKG